ncbi:hypothetical protein AB6878_03685 [Carnobacterium maltaromaticum]|uniref:hypothetical protein n=3 Tax=Carnobacterium maltaromaticum TaxID=2751 RepID=UPI0039BE702E
MDVKTSSGGWETMRSSVGNVVGKGAWGKGVIDDLKDITKNLEKAEEKISAKDEDGVVSFHHLDRTTTYQEIYEKMEVLYGFTNKAHDLVDETIDEKFYQEIDKYAVAMRDLTINKYSTKNITGATKQELVFTSSSMQEMQTVSKDKITVDDLFSDSSPLGKKMKADFDQYRLSQGDKEIKYEDFKQSMLNTGAFEYTSIKDKQMKKEMWVNLGIAAVIVIASIAFPPAGMALGLVVSSLEVGSAITGKDWVSGRELGTGERVFRGVLGGVGLGTELYALNSFSKNVRLASQIKYGGEGATSVQHLGDMVANSGKSSYGRVTEFGNSVKLNSTDSGIIYTKNSNIRNKKINVAEGPLTMEEFLQEMDELPRARLSQKVEDGLVSTPKGERLDPSVYMSKNEIDTHLSLFDDGAVKIQNKESFENAVNKYGSSIGDPDTGTYVMPKSVVDKAISVSNGDPRVLEKLLGLDPGYLGDTPILLDINKVDGLRVPTGNESGAWQGLWEPGGFTNGGIPEAVVNQIQGGTYTVTDVFK